MTNKLQKILAGVCLAGAVGMNGCGKDYFWKHTKINGKPISECDPIGWAIDLSADLHEIEEKHIREHKVYEKWKIENSEELTFDQWYNQKYNTNTSNKPHKN